MTRASELLKLVGEDLVEKRKRLGRLVKPLSVSVLKKIANRIKSKLKKIGESSAGSEKKNKTEENFDSEGWKKEESGSFIHKSGALVVVEHGGVNYYYAGKEQPSGSIDFDDLEDFADDFDIDFDDEDQVLEMAIELAKEAALEEY